MGCGASVGGEGYEMEHPDGVGGLFETRARPGEGKASPRPQRGQHSTAASLYLPGTVVCVSDDELLEALGVQAEWLWHKELQHGDPEPQWKEGTAQAIAADLRAEHASAQEEQYDKPGNAAVTRKVEVRIKGMPNSSKVFEDLEEAAKWLGKAAGQGNDSAKVLLSNIARDHPELCLCFNCGTNIPLLSFSAFVAVCQTAAFVCCCCFLVC